MPTLPLLSCSASELQANLKIRIPGPNYGHHPSIPIFNVSNLIKEPDDCVFFSLPAYSTHPLVHRTRYSRKTPPPHVYIWRNILWTRHQKSRTLEESAPQIRLPTSDHPVPMPTGSITLCCVIQLSTDRQMAGC